MLKILFVLLFCLASQPLFLAADEWTNKEGKTIEAEFRGFKIDRSKMFTEQAHEGFGVELEAQNGDRGTFPLTEFPPEEWKHLRKAGADYAIRLTQKHLPALALQTATGYLGCIFALWAAARLMKSERGIGTAVQYSTYVYLLTFVATGLGFLSISGVLPLVGLRVMTFAIFIGMLVLYLGMYDFGCGGTILLVILHAILTLPINGVIMFLSHSFYDFTEYYDHMGAMYVISILDALIEQMGPEHFTN